MRKEFSESPGNFFLKENPFLCFETSGPQGSGALFIKGHCVTTWNGGERGTQGARLMPQIQEALAQHALAYQDLHALVTCTGPGSFTGIRLGLATAQGLRVALNIPVLGISAFDVSHHKAQRTLESLTSSKNAHAAITNDQGPSLSWAPILVVLQAFRKDVFCQFYPGPCAAKDFPPVNISISEIPMYTEHTPFVLAGNAEAQILESKDPVVTSLIQDTLVGHFSAEDLGIYALSLPWLIQEKYTQESLEPFYLRSPDVSVSP